MILYFVFVGDAVKKPNESLDSRTENLASLDECASQEEHLKDSNKTSGLSKGRLDLSNFDYLECYKAWKNLKKIQIPKRKKKKKNNKKTNRTVEIYRDENYCTDGRYTDDEDFNYSNH